MADILMLTADSLLELNMRLACMAANLRFHVNFSEDATFGAVVVDIENLDASKAELARNLVKKGIPTLAIAAETPTQDATDVVADVCLRKPVESGTMVYRVLEMLSDRTSAPHQVHNEPMRAAC